MSDIKVHHLAPQEFIEFELNSRESMKVRIAYLGPVPDTDKVSIATEVKFWDEIKDDR